MIKQFIDLPVMNVAKYISLIQTSLAARRVILADLLKNYVGNNLICGVCQKSSRNRTGITRHMKTHEQNLNRIYKNIDYV